MALTLDAGNKRVVDDQARRTATRSCCSPRLHSASTALGDGTDHLLPDARRLSAAARLTQPGRVRNHRRRVHRIGIGGVAGDNGKQVVLIFPEAAIGSRMYPPELATFMNGSTGTRGWKFGGDEGEGCGTRMEIGVETFTTGEQGGAQEVIVDGIVAGIGARPNVELAQTAGLTVDNGIRVDASLRTSDSSIYAAGDVASIHNPSLNQWIRVEHEDNANMTGGFAGAAMAGRTVSYDHLPFFYSDMFDLGTKRSARWTHACRWYGLEDAQPRGRDLLPARRPGARRAALEHFRTGGCGPPS